MKMTDPKRAPAPVQGKPEDLRRQVLELAARLAEAEETISAIRSGLVDAVIVDTPEGAQIYTLQGADRAYRVFLEAMGEGALTVTREGLIRYANRRFAKIAGKPLEKIMGESLFSLVAPEERHLLEALLRLGVLGGGRGEFSLQAGEGEAVPVSLSISPLPESDPPAFCLVVADLSDQKKAEAELERYWKHLEDLVNERTADLVEAKARVEERVRERTAELSQDNAALKESEERLRRLFDQSPLGATLVAPDFRFLKVNEAFCRITGYSAEEMTSLTFPAITHPEDLEADLEQAKRLQRGEIEEYELEKRYLRKDGEPVWVRLHARAVRDEGGNLLYSCRWSRTSRSARRWSGWP
jgi:two-component system, OmpR family, phosphate regulon sensor histidine kinase PhoR